MAPDPFRITQQVPGGQPVDLTEQVSSCSWSSSIPGGFGSAQLTIPRLLTQKERGLLGMITIEHDGRVLFDGRIEDAFTSGSKTSISTDLVAYGFQRLLNDNSVRRIWSLRTSLNPTASTNAKGSNTSGLMALTNSAAYTFGRYDTASPTKYGFQIRLTAPVASLSVAQVGVAIPSGLAGVRVMFDVRLQGADVDFAFVLHSSADNVNYTRHVQQVVAGAPTSYDVALVDNAIDVRFGGTAVAATADEGIVEVSNLRIIGTPIPEDSAGGFYGGTILRDVVALCPGLYPGTIENGSDFVIAEIQRVNRSSALSVVQEIVPLYAREWGVWEAGRFDWITPDLVNPGWVVPLTKVSEWRIEQSLDSVQKRTYVTFTDAADQQQKEAYADSGQSRNPYVRVGVPKDGVVPAPAAMTSLTAPLLAAKLNNDYGRWPDIKGSVTLPAGAMITAANSARTIPALAIRAGDNVTIPDLPVEDIYASGQDGQTVFHVTGVQASTDATVQITLEGLTRRADVLMARLSAFNR